jgi:hypothetical protein
MTTLPGGIDRTTYGWPQVSVIHPEHGAYEMAVHCIQNPDSGAMVLLAFAGHTKPNSLQRSEQIDLVADVATNMNDVIVPLDESDVTGDVLLLLAAKFHAEPGVQLILMQVERPAA